MVLAPGAAGATRGRESSVMVHSSHGRGVRATHVRAMSSSFRLARVRWLALPMLFVLCDCARTCGTVVEEQARLEQAERVEYSDAPARVWAVLVDLLAERSVVLDPAVPPLDRPTD